MNRYDQLCGVASLLFLTLWVSCKLTAAGPASLADSGTPTTDSGEPDSGTSSSDSGIPIVGDFFVSPDGDDANAGSESSPFATITYASTQVQPGQVVEIMAGIYSENVRIETSGSEGQPITFYGQPGAIVDGSNLDLSGGGDYEGLFIISGQSHIIVDGITLRNTNHHAFAVNPGNENDVISDITIRNCRTENTDGSGILVYGHFPFVKYQISTILIDNNEIITPQMGVFNGNRRFHEDITIGGGVEDFVISRNHVDVENQDRERWDGGPLGIDVKDGVRNGKIFKNHVENVPSQGIYVDAYLDGASNIEVFQNLVHGISGYGIVVGAEAGGRLDDVKVYNNIVYDSRWGGVRVADYIIDGFTPTEKTNVHIFNNTLYGVDISSTALASGKIYNNLVDTTESLDIAGSYDVSNNCEDAPQFVDAVNGDFHLQSGSPCIDVGISAGAPSVDFDGNARPQGGGYDTGAFEYSP